MDNTLGHNTDPKNEYFNSIYAKNLSAGNISATNITSGGNPFSTQLPPVSVTVASNTTNNQSATFIFYKQGRDVQMRLEFLDAVLAADVFNFPSAVPSGYRPIETSGFPLTVKNNSVLSNEGYLIVGASGQITIYGNVQTQNFAIGTGGWPLRQYASWTTGE